MPTAKKNSSSLTDRFSICPSCDLLVKKISPVTSHTVICPRCLHRLHCGCSNSVQRTLVLAVTGLLLYLPAIFYPLMTVNMLGGEAGISLFGSTLSMFSQGRSIVGIIVVLTGMICPLLTLSLLFWVTAGLRFGWKAGWMPIFLRWYYHLTEWAMTDIYLIGVFITIIKMSDTVRVQFDMGFFCFIGLVVSSVAAQASVDRVLFWEQMETRKENPQEKKIQVSIAAKTGSEAGLLLCHTCHKAVLPILPITPEAGKKICCPRCGDTLHPRKKNSIDRSWALIVTAVIFTLPANLLPIMSVTSFGQAEGSTIINGIIHFFKEGSYGIGTVILTASVLVPLFKISGLALILVSIHYKWASWLRHKTLMFRFIEFIGRWSMLDIFVIALLCALVRFGRLSAVNAEPAALYFTAVVLCTMFAAISFDSRLLWDDEVDSGTDGVKE